MLLLGGSFYYLCDTYDGYLSPDENVKFDFYDVDCTRIGLLCCCYYSLMTESCYYVFDVVNFRLSTILLTVESIDNLFMDRSMLDFLW